MKPTHLAGIIIAILGAAVVFLLVKDSSDAKQAELNDRLNQMQAMLTERLDAAARQTAVAPPAPTAPVAPTPVAPAPAPVPAPAPSAIGATETLPPATATAPPPATDDAAAVAAREQALIKDNAAALRQSLKDTAPTPDDLLSPLALRIRKLPALCKVSEVQAGHGFVLLDAGENVGLTKDVSLCVRRDHMIVAKIKVADVKSDTSSVADILPKSVPLGVSIQVGDEIVQFTENQP